MADHKPGCEALGGYGQGVGPCGCGADAQTPVLTDEDGLPIGFAKAYSRAFAGQPVDNKRLAACEEMWIAAQAPAQPDRAVMQQAQVDALINASREADEGPSDLVRRVWAAAITALSATLEKPNGN